MAAMAKKAKTEQPLSSVAASQLLALLEAYYSDEENERAYREWKAARAAEKKKAAG